SEAVNTAGGRPTRMSTRGQILPLDSDGDGVPDYQDYCPNTLVGSVVNSQGCSIEQLCPCDGTGENHGQLGNCMKGALKEFDDGGLITPLQERMLLESAAQSDCGKQAAH